MTDGIETRESPQAQAEPARRPLTRERILHAGLQLINEQGLEAFTMRKLAGRVVLLASPDSQYVSLIRRPSMRAVDDDQ